MEYTLVWFHPNAGLVGGLAPRISQESREDALAEIAQGALLDAWKIRPMRHKSKTLALWDSFGNLVAIAQRVKNPL